MPKKSASAIDAFIGARIKEIRIKRRVTQAESGRAINVRFQQMQKYERGDNRMSAAQLHALAKFYGVPISAFLPNIAQREPARLRNGELDREAQAVTDFAASKKGFVLLRAFLALDDDTRTALIAFARMLARKRQRPRGSGKSTTS